MSDQDDIQQTAETTGDSEAIDQPDNTHIDTERPNYLINPSKKEECRTSGMVDLK